jgi:hypothetical protein
VANRNWKFKLRNQVYSLDLDHNTVTGKTKIFLDGEKVVETGINLADSQGVHRFEVAGYPCAVVIKSNGLTFSYDLVVKGVSYETRQPVDLDTVVQPQKSKKSNKPARQFDGSTPIWAWLFICGCGAIPIVTLGGAIPGMIGFGFGSAVYRLSRNPSFSFPVRFFGSVVLTGTAWGLLFVFGFGAVLLRSQL